MKITEHNISANAGGNLERISDFAIGISSFGIFGFLFSYVLYPFVIYAFGIFGGGAIMTLLSFLVCIVLLRIYDSSKRDWLGIETIKKLKGYEGSKKLGKVTAWFLTKSELVIFLFLSIKLDPFITTAYLRKGAHQFNGMSRRDWEIFISSLFLSNAYWTLACYMGITLVEWAWKKIIE